MEKQKNIIVAGPKGGNAKSLTAALIIELCNHLGIPIDMIDADPGQTLRAWVQYCAQESRVVVQEDASLLVVDTAGSDGGSLPWLNKADLVVCPFRPNFADLDRIGAWFNAFPAAIQRKFVFVPIAVGLAAGHQRGIQALVELVKQQGNGTVLQDCVIKNREGVYPRVLEGMQRNFFMLGYRYKDARQESARMGLAILRRVGVKEDKLKGKNL